MYKKSLILLLAFAFNFSLHAQKNSFPLDETLPATELNDKSALTLLNSRLGSRFSCTFNTGDMGIHTGALGFDVDEFSELLIEVEYDNKKYIFRTANQFGAAKYFDNQKMQIGMTAMQLTGTTNEINVTATLVSPFTPSKELKDSSLIKIQIVPAFYFLIDVENKSSKNITGKIKIGLKKLAYDRSRYSGKRSWTFGYERKAVFFKDVSGASTLLGISTIDSKTYHFKESAFQGLEAKFEAKANSTVNEKFIYASYHSEKVQYDRKYNLPLHFYYTKYWKNIDEVIKYAQDNITEILEKSNRFENILKNSGSSPKEKWVTALAFHTDLANTYFLIDTKGKARFYVIEGRFRHQSTIDVAHETELNAIFCPWRLKIQLEQWIEYMARNEVFIQEKHTPNGIEIHTEGMSAAEYGPYLFHDVGDFPFISPTSEYSFGPHMAVEENSTYTLLLYWYWKLTGDDEFVRSKLGMVEILLHSLTNRDTDESGIADKGMGWSTYDVSEAIKRSPENVYLGIKQMCAYTVAAEMFVALANEDSGDANQTKQNVQDGDGLGYVAAKLGNKKLRERQAKRYIAEAEKIAASIKSAYKKYGYVPVSLDQSFEGWDQHSIVIGEGLFLPGLAGNESKLLKQTADYLGKTYKTAVDKSTTEYGIKLSSEEPVTWFSKVMVSDIVASNWYGINQSTADYTYQWNKNNPDAYNDGASSTTEKWIGYWYPRGISSLGYILRDKNFKATEVEKFLKELK